MNIKKIKPTPRSMTQRKPTSISPSSRSKNQPRSTKYIPARYHKTWILKVLTKKIATNNMVTCKIILSFNISCS